MTPKHRLSRPRKSTWSDVEVQRSERQTHRVTRTWILCLTAAWLATAVPAPAAEPADAGSGTAHAGASETGGGSSTDSDRWTDYKEDLLRRFPTVAPRVGEIALDHTGIDLDGNPVRLADMWARKPVVLEFGTCT